MATARNLNILIAAGGTGGHLFPAQALALELLEKHPTIQVTFVGAGLGENPYFKKELFPFLDIQSAPPFRKDPLRALKALFSIFKGILRAFKFIKKKKPDLIVGFGSYHSFPAIYAAKLKNIPILIFESNALPGRVNRFCSKWAKVSAIQFPHASQYLKSHSVCVQMPLLKTGEGVTKKMARRYFHLEEDKLTFLVFGGSQGAQAINCFFCGSLELLLNQGIEFQVIHIVGHSKRAEKLEEVYEKYQISAAVKVFEEKMECAWKAADLSISRAGAATLAEMIEFTVPSILIPYPFAAENHQLKNAAFVTDEIKGAVTLEEKGLQETLLSNAIIDLLSHSQKKLKEMKSALQTFKNQEDKQDLCGVVLNTL